MQKEMTYCRWAPSLGELEGTAEEAWGTPPYVSWKHRDKPCVFFGLYDLRDYLALWLHRGKKYVLWTGSDLRNLDQGFIFNDGKLKLLSRLFKDRLRKRIKRILAGAEHWVENDWEKEVLLQNGVVVEGVCPSFLGDIHKYEISYKPDILNKVHVYLSASEGRQEEYGWKIVENIASALPRHIFHLYGAGWKTKQQNVIVHGRVPKEQMNEDIKGYQIALRLNETDGTSEILAKAVLMGQYAIGLVQHPKIPAPRNYMELIAKLHVLGKEDEPNHEARNYYLNAFNRFPWVCRPASISETKNTVP